MKHKLVDKKQKKENLLNAIDLIRKRIDRCEVDDFNCEITNHITQVCPDNYISYPVPTGSSSISLEIRLFEPDVFNSKLKEIFDECDLREQK